MIDVIKSYDNFLRYYTINVIAVDMHKLRQSLACVQIFLRNTNQDRPLLLALCLITLLCWVPTIFAVFTTDRNCDFTHEKFK